MTKIVMLDKATSSDAWNSAAILLISAVTTALGNAITKYVKATTIMQYHS